MEKYKWKNRILLIKTPNYNNKKYRDIKNLYENNLQEFHKRYVKFLTDRNKNYKFQIELYGFDGNLKKKLESLNISNLFKLIDQMPLAKLKEQFPKLKPKNLSLYSDYHKETTIHGLGFKNKEKAIFTIEKIKNEPIKYQKSVINTMIGRAKTHPYQTEDMREAIVIFQNWIKKHK